MTTYKDRIAVETRDQREGRPQDPAPWNLIYQAMRAELIQYIDAAVARAVDEALDRRLASAGLGVAAAAARAMDARRAAEAMPVGPREVVSSAAMDDLFETGPLPAWLQPFSLPDKVRFTRTPDAILRGTRPSPAPEPVAPAVIEAPLAAPAAVPTRLVGAASASFDAPQPPWRTPVTLPPNVRFNRSPMRRADGVRVEEGGETIPAESQADAEAAGALDARLPTGFEALLAPPEPQAAPEPETVTARPPVWLHVFQAEEPVPLHPANEDGTAAKLPLLPDLPEEDSVALALALGDDEDVAAPLPALPGPSAAVAPAALAAQALAAPAVEAPAMRPTGIASAEDARAFAGRSRDLGGKRSPGTPRSLAPIEMAEAITVAPDLWEDPPLDLLAEPPAQDGEVLSSGALEQNARLLEGVLEEFGVRGEIIDVRPGPVVTLYEFEPAPGTKSSRVIGLSDDIARSMSAVSARVAVVQGRNVIGIELPNQRREMVFLRELLAGAEFADNKHKLAIALGKSIGGESIIVDLARMPHLLVAGTTGSGKSVAINTMILSILYRLKPEQCRLIMVDPKMLELSIYEGIPHLLTPVVTDPKKAVVALKWAVREMEDRYRKMSKVGVRNIDGFNARVAEAAARGEIITRTVQTGYNRETGQPIFESEDLDLAPLPYIVVIVDEMADLMMVAGKDIEGAIQRLAQMARAAGIHLIMATQRPSVDVITGTIKANFPTRISFQVTSKIDSRTILGEQGAEQLLGQGDMLYMAGGGRISRVHGPFVSDAEVEKVVTHLKAQGHPAYLDVVVADEEAAEPAKPEAPEDKPVFERGAMGEDDNELYEQAVKVVLRDKKCSTSYIQRRLQVGYNKAASLVERMEKEGLVGQANNAGKREILVYSRDLRFIGQNREGEE